MSRKAPLSCQTAKHFVVIRKNKELPLKLLLDYLKNNYEEWALIVHEKDIDPITKITIPIHYHYVGNAIKKRVMLQHVLNDLAKLFKTDTNGIEVDKYDGLEKSVQYLIHKNNPEKTQHNVSEIFFGGWTKEELDTILSADSNGINYDRVVTICLHTKSICEVIKQVGFGSYARYRSTILDIFKEKQYGLKPWD